MKPEMTKIKEIRDRPVTVPMKKPHRTTSGGLSTERLRGTNHY
jgi:hypothetical protein